MKLKTKIHIFTTLLMLILLVLTNSGVYVLYEKLAYDTEFEQLKLRTDELITTLNQLEADSDPKQVLRAYMPLNGAVRVIDEAGKVKISVEAALSLKDAISKTDEDAPYGTGEIEGVPFMTFTTSTIWLDGMVVEIEMLQLLDDVANNMELLQLILIAVTVVAAIPILLSSIVLSRIILKPLERLSETMKKSATSGTYEKIAKAREGKDELAEIGRTFNGMMDALETNYKKQQQFVSNASHELKTPLTVIESYASLLVRHGFSNEKVAKEALEAIMKESSRMNDMIVQMLELAKNKEHVMIRWQQINVTELLENTLSQMSQAYSRNFELIGFQKAFAISDEQLLKQLFFIILDNARKYSEDRIEVTIVNAGDTVEVTIHDFGHGIPENQLPHLFERFYRVSEDRNRKTGGTGLGLSIAKELAEHLHIEMTVESEQGAGTCFTLMLPSELNGLEGDGR